MEHQFWHERWQNNELGWHELSVNPMLEKHVDALSLNPGDRVFLPMCGKTRDLHWLQGRGYRVVGAELSSLAVEQLWQELGIKPSIETFGDLKRYSAENIDIWQGDIFDLKPDQLGAVHACYDRGALVALPSELRFAYTEHLSLLIGGAPQLVICYQYPQQEMPGPPFSIDQKMLATYYRERYQLLELENRPMHEGLKELSSAEEHVWLLEPND